MQLLGIPGPPAHRTTHPRILLLWTGSCVPEGPKFGMIRPSRLIGDCKTCHDPSFGPVCSRVLLWVQRDAASEVYTQHKIVKPLLTGWHAQKAGGIWRAGLQSPSTLTTLARLWRPCRSRSHRQGGLRWSAQPCCETPTTHTLALAAHPSDSHPAAL